MVQRAVEWGSARVKAIAADFGATVWTLQSFLSCPPVYQMAVQRPAVRGCTVKYTNSKDFPLIHCAFILFMRNENSLGLVGINGHELDCPDGNNRTIEM